MPTIFEEALLRLYHEKDLSQREIADLYGVTQPWISKKMKEYGIESRYEGSWNEEEIELMETYYPDEKELLKSELNRSWNAIKLKAIDLGLARDQEKYRNSDEVAEQLRVLAKENELEINFGMTETLSYVLGVIDGDGFDDDKGTFGLEVKSRMFADKFSAALNEIGLNPGRGKREGKETVWASSKQLKLWMKKFDLNSKFEWLKDSGDMWNYIEGIYDSDGDFSHPGPRICSYDEEEKKFIKNILDYLGLETTIQSNNVYVRTSSKEKFFANVDPVYEKRSP